MSLVDTDSPRRFTAAEVKEVVRVLRSTGKFQPDELAAMELLCSILRSAAASPGAELASVVQSYLQSISAK